MPFVDIFPSKIFYNNSFHLGVILSVNVTCELYFFKYVFQAKRYTTKVAASRASTGPLSETIHFSRIEVVNSVVEPLAPLSKRCSSSAKDKGKSVPERSIKFLRLELAI